jgi:hypothetical protein
VWTLLRLCPLRNEEVKEFIEDIPQEHRFRLIQSHLRQIKADNEEEIAALKEEFLSKFATDEQRATLEKRERNAGLGATEIPDEPDAAHAFIASLPSRKQSDAWRQFYWKLSRKGRESPLETVAEAERNGIHDREPYVISSFYQNVGSSWVESDPRAAFEWARSLDEGIREDVLDEILSDLSDPLLAKDLFAEISPDHRSSKTVKRISADWSLFDPESPTKWVWAQQDQMAELDSPLHYAVSKWLASDPDEAVSWLAMHEDVLANREHSELVSETVFRRDRTRAIEIATSLPASEGKTRMIEGIARGLMQSGMVESIAFADQLEDSDLRLAAVREIAESGVYVDPGRVFDWIGGLEPEAKVAAQAAVLNSHRDASDLIAEIAIDWFAGPEREALVSKSLSGVKTIANFLAAGSVEDAQSWAAELPAGPVQDSAISGIARSWTAHQPMEAAEWIANLPEGVARDDATEHLARNLPDDPVMALAWAESIGNSAKRSVTAKAKAGLTHEKLRES